jgi:hypothetical protein
MADRGPAVRVCAVVVFCGARALLDFLKSLFWKDAPGGIGQSGGSFSWPGAHGLHEGSPLILRPSNTSIHRVVVNHVAVNLEERRAARPSSTPTHSWPRSSLAGRCWLLTTTTPPKPWTDYRSGGTNDPRLAPSLSFVRTRDPATQAEVRVRPCETGPCSPSSMRSTDCRRFLGGSIVVFWWRCVSAPASYAGIFPNFWLPSGMGVQFSLLSQ